MPPKKPKIIAVVGPTASGKSDLAVEIAKQIGGEVISADSRQVYRGLDIGSGKITKREMKGVPHHLLDVASPSRVYSVARYKRDAEKAIMEIIKRGNIPVVCGGTGFYVDALLYDMQFSDVKPNPTLRKSLAKKTTEELFSELTQLDPRRAEAIDRHNRVRLVRAIEIARQNGSVEPVSTSSRYDLCLIGIKVDKELLSERIAVRIEKRIKKGMLKEFEKLHKEGLSYKRMETLGLEYRFGARLLQNKTTKQEFKDQLFAEIVKYAKRQMTWFKRNKEIHWIEIGDTEAALETVKKFIKQ